MVCLSILLLLPASFAEENTNKDAKEISVQRVQPELYKGGRLEPEPMITFSGSNCLKWTWEIGSGLMFIVDDSKNTLVSFYLYNGKKLPGKKLRIEAGSDEETTSTRNIDLDFYGWRLIEFFLDDIRKEGKKIDFIRLMSPSSGKGFFCLENIDCRVKEPRFNHASPLVPWSLDRDLLDGSTKLNDIQPVVKKDLVKSVQDIRAKLLSTLSYANSYFIQLSGIQSGWEKNIDENIIQQQFDDYKIEFSEDGVSGTPIDIVKFDKLLLLTAVAYHSEKDSKKKAKTGSRFIKMTKYMLAMGYADGSVLNKRIGYDSVIHYYPFLIMRELLIKEGLISEVTASLRWACFAGRIMHEPPPSAAGDCIMLYAPNPVKDYSLNGGNMDYWIADSQNHLISILIGDDDARQAAMLKKYIEWVEESVCPVQYDSRDGFKPDGSLYHHWMHYAGYGLPALNLISFAVPLLDKTPFEYTPKTYEVFKNAFMMTRIWAYPQYGAVACGRHPLGGTWDGKDRIKEMALSRPGTDEADKELASVYLRLADLGKDDAEKIFLKKIKPEPQPSGYWSMNHASAGIFHTGNYAVHFKGWASTDSYMVWDEETYATDNRFGRYLSHGTIEIFKYHDTYLSGFQCNGWNWSMIPGTTSLLLPFDVLEGGKMDYPPKIPQKAPFSGSCHLDNKAGVFAFQLDYDKSTNTQSLAMKKSSFAFESGIIVCLGSGISNSSEKYETITTLFQNGIPSTDTPISFNKAWINEFPYEKEIASPSGTELIDAFGSCYRIIFVSPDTKLILKRSLQESLHDKNKTQTKGNFATAWLSHGKSPKESSYHYAIIPGGKKDSFKAFSEPDTMPYTVLQHDKSAHAVIDIATKTLGCVVYEPEGALNVSNIVKTSKPCLIMMRPSADKRSFRMGIADPDLNYKEKSPTVIKIELKGKWRIPALEKNVKVEQISGDTTIIAVTCDHGIPVNFDLIKERAM